MKIKVGDKYELTGACQYGHTRDGIKIVIDPFDTITKIRDNFCDHLKLRNMWQLDNTEYEVSIDNSIVERYFERCEKDNDY